MTCLHRRVLVVVAVCLAVASATAIAQEPNLTEQQMREFLLKAKIVDSRPIGKGVTSPWRLTLSDGSLKHDAAFQPIDENKVSEQLSDGTTEFGFRDSYHFNIAAFELAKLVGLGDMIPAILQS